LSKLVTISKLEALLSRIRTRAAEPRSGRAAAAPAPPPSVVVAPPAAIAPPPVVVAPSVVVAAPVVVAPAPVAPPAFVAPSAPVGRAAREPSPEPPEAIALDEPTLPPPPFAGAGDVDIDVDVDVTTGTPEPAPAVAASEVQDATDSRERLSAAPPVRLESLPADAEDVGPSIEQVDELANEVNEGGIPGDDDEGIEETPASSRRPVTAPPEERLAELAFGAEEPQPARHTPPPKSGRLPAPPAVEFDADVTGVRAASTVATHDDAMAPSSEGREPSVLSAQAVRPNLASGTDVRAVDVIGEAQRFAPATFLALLDASLSL
jgi:hypothetical protein